MKKNIVVAFFAAVVFMAYATTASAHVTVKPAEVKVAAFTDFSVGVPVERDIPTISIRLVIPEGLEHVSPHLKSGWKIEVKRGESHAVEGAEHAEEGPITEITWSGNEIPAGFKDVFSFSAKAPATAGSVVWKAYQTYKDGTVVSWDVAAEQQPKGADGKPDFSKFGPFSETKVIDDLAAEGSDVAQPEDSGNKGTLALALSVAAVILAGYSLLKK